MANATHYPAARILKGTNGKVIRTTLTDEEAYEILAENVLGASEYVRKLVDGYARYGRFTENQTFYAHEEAMMFKGELTRPALGSFTAQPARPASAAGSGFGRSTPGFASAPFSQAHNAASAEAKLAARVAELEARLAAAESTNKTLVEFNTGLSAALTRDHAVEFIPPAAPAPAPEPAPAPASMPEVFRIFQTAGEALKHPKVRFDVGGTLVVLSVAGGRSKHPGSIHVTDAGRYPTNRYFGRIHTDGRFEPGRDCEAKVVEFLAAFAADPVGTAAAYGRRTGNCCFCNKGLKTAKKAAGRALYATDLGYGPECAKKWGLPWGLAAASAADAAKAAAGG